MANKSDNAKDPKKSTVERAASKVRSAWSTVGVLAKKAKNHWQMRPGESRRDSRLPAENPHENYDGVDTEVSLESVRQDCSSSSDDEQQQEREQTKKITAKGEEARKK